MYALVTGASSGIGMEISKLLAMKKYDLILVARREERLMKLKSDIENRYKINVIVKKVDLSKEKECIRLFNECEKYNIGILINNAGFGKVGNFEDIPLDTEINMIKTNIIAVHILTKLFIRKYEKGYILNIASIAAFQPGPLLSVYSATKSYVLNFSTAVNYELKKQKKDIYITTLCPGPVNTEFNEVAGADFNLKSINPKKCAKIALKGMFNKKNIVIPAFGIRLLHLGSKIAPYRLVLPVEYKIQSKKKRLENN